MDGATLDAIAFLGVSLGAGPLPLYRDGAGPKWCMRGGLLPRFVERWSDLEVASGLACDSAHIETLTSSMILWAWVEGGEQVGRAQQFTPKPSLVLRMGKGCSRRLLIWALRNPIDTNEAEEANRRIAYRLGAQQKPGRPGLLRVPIPGSMLKVGRAKPVPVLVTRITTDDFAPGFTAKLPEPPPRDAWRKRQAA
jgi:hypothetical protein